MRIYVATKWEEATRAQAVMALLRDRGHVITYDWTVQEQESAQQAIADCEGVVSADLVILLLENPLLPYRGTWVELGIALAAQKPVLVFAPKSLPCLFLQHPLVRRVLTREALLDAVSRIATAKIVSELV